MEISCCKQPNIQVPFDWMGIFLDENSVSPFSSSAAWSVSLWIPHLIRMCWTWSQVTCFHSNFVWFWRANGISVGTADSSRGEAGGGWRGGQMSRLWSNVLFLLLTCGFCALTVHDPEAPNTNPNALSLLWAVMVQRFPGIGGMLNFCWLTILILHITLILSSSVAVSSILVLVFTYYWHMYRNTMKNIIFSDMQADDIMNAITQYTHPAGDAKRDRKQRAESCINVTIYSRHITLYFSWTLGSFSTWTMNLTNSDYNPYPIHLVQDATDSNSHIFLHWIFVLCFDQFISSFDLNL